MYVTYGGPGCCSSRRTCPGRTRRGLRELTFQIPLHLADLSEEEEKAPPAAPAEEQKADVVPEEGKGEGVPLPSEDGVDLEALNKENGDQEGLGEEGRKVGKEKLEAVKKEAEVVAVQKEEVVERVQEKGGQEDDEEDEDGDADDADEDGEWEYEEDEEAAAVVKLEPVEPPEPPPPPPDPPVFSIKLLRLMIMKVSPCATRAHMWQVSCQTPNHNAAAYGPRGACADRDAHGVQPVDAGHHLRRQAHRLHRDLDGQPAGRGTVACGAQKAR